MYRKCGWFILVLGFIFSLLTGCISGKSSTVNQLNPTPDAPATLVVYNISGDPEEVFNARWGDDLRKKFPNYTFQYMIGNSKDTQLPNLVANGSQIDIVLSSLGVIDGVFPLGIQYDLTDLAKKHGVDLSRIEPKTLDGIKQYGGLYGLPINSGGLVVYYNKDIFDKFGVSYPKDGMTWDDMTNLAKKLTKVDQGIQYIGLGASYGHLSRMNQLSLPFVDKNTNKATINNDQWKQFLQTAVVNSIQGISDPSSLANLLSNPNDAFQKDRNIAMYIMNYGLQDNPAFQNFNWDMVALPTFQANPGVGSQPYPLYALISSSSQNKDQAMEVLKFLTSDEEQMHLSKKGIVPILNNDAVKNAFGQETPYKDKNIKNANFYNHYAVPHSQTTFDGAVIGAIGFKDLITGNADINTVLRTAEDKANQAITTALQNQ
ncbi:MAG: hypothetical protein JWN30_2725 [Bacilli bacterium]|nr:hypothetical protein [Bacilli bacterium]